jgi:hypothetical protein
MLGGYPLCTGSVVCCNLRRKTILPFQLYTLCIKSAVAVLCLAFITSCLAGSPWRTVRAGYCELVLWPSLLCLRVLPSGNVYIHRIVS